MVEHAASRVQAHGSVSALAGSAILATIGAPFFHCVRAPRTTASTP